MNKTQNVVFKKVLTMLMAVMMVFTMMPSMAWADDSDPGNDVPSTTETITVYMTVSDQGELALAKNGTVMAWVPVEDTGIPRICKLACSIAGASRNLLCGRKQRIHSQSDRSGSIQKY